MAFTVVIPARLASTRLPRKVLLDIAGKPMLERVYQQALASSAAEVVIATDSDEVVEVAQGFSANVVKTRADHPSGTDRLQEVAQHFGFDDKHIIVNVQGDEPLLPPALIDQVAQNLAANPQAGIATLCEPITELDEVLNPNAVKVVFDKNGKALYFSRASIPFAREGFNLASAQWYRHIGIYAYRSGFLHDFVSWPPAPLEQTEHLEQLRAMYNGVDIHVDVAAQTVPAGVDTEADLTAVRAFFEARP
ncbi:MAG: 3-deoxy-manno-octulosonate cytidylyltransferase [Gammaproteobacteria bacterium]|nr:MAG: 3-deoxy-manno-octulosonate cytidylyltransferase [Gammaproteobacteria bacterium]